MKTLENTGKQGLLNGKIGLLQALQSGGSVQDAIHQIAEYRNIFYQKCKNISYFLVFFKNPKISNKSYHTSLLFNNLCIFHNVNPEPTKNTT